MKRRYLSAIILLVLLLGGGSYILMRSGEQPARAAPPLRPLSDATWSANVRVNDDAGPAWQGYASIAVDSSGNAYALWTDERLDNIMHIYFSYRPAGGPWTANVRVDDDTGAASVRGGSIAVDPRGNAHAVWGGNPRIGIREIYSSYRPARGTWGANARVNDDAVYVDRVWQEHPSTAVDSTGNAYALWCDLRNGNYDIYFSYRPAGGSWGANVMVNDDAGATWQYSPSIAVNVSGNAYAAWEDARSGNWWDVYFSYRGVSGTWGPNVRVNDDAGVAAQVEPSIAVDVSGNAYAVWHDTRNGDYDIYFSYRPAGGTWGANARVNDDAGTTRQLSPSIAVDSSGNAYAVWQDERNGNYDIYFSYRPAGGTWGANVRVNDDAGTAAQGEPSIAADGSGNAYAVWEDNRNGEGDIYFSYRSAGGGPLLQLPFDPSHQTGACRNSQNGLNCINSFFDHSYPTSGTNGDITLYSGKVWRDNVNVNNCTLRRNCYDGHDAYDLGLFPSTPVLAAAGGYATHHSDPCAGHIVQIDHGNGYATQYLHLKDDTYLLRTPRTVTAGERIGSVGQPASTACGHGYHLHFVALHNGKKVDPYGWAGNYQDPWEAHVDGTRSNCLWTFGCPTKGVLSSTSGGALGSSDGNVMVFAPPGAVTNTTWLQLALSPDPVAEPSAVPAWHSFALSTQDLSGNPVIDFSEPLTVDVSYSDTDIAYLWEDSLSLYSWDDSISAWLPISTTLDLANNTASANVTHLSLFTLMGQPQNLAPTVTSVSPSSGYSHLDTEITISGTNFISTPSVRLGLNELAVTFVNSTTLTAIVPSGLEPGAYDLTVTNPDAQEDTLESAFTVLEPLKVYLPLILKNY